jgi:hypothetical protein
MANDSMLDTYKGMTTQELLGLIPTLTPDKLTYLAEALGDKSPDIHILWTLLGLLWHPNPLVREGAMYGLNSYKQFEHVQYIIKLVSQLDASNAIRGVAKDWLNNAT